MMMQKTGILQSFRYRNPNGVGVKQSVLIIRFLGPDGDEHTHSVPNGEFGVQNPTMQFLASIDRKPSDIDGTDEDISDEKRQIPVVYDNGTYHITQQPFTYGKQRLEKADWMFA